MTDEQREWIDYNFNPNNETYEDYLHEMELVKSGHYSVDHKASETFQDLLAEFMKEDDETI